MVSRRTLFIMLDLLGARASRALHPTTTATCVVRKLNDPRPTAACLQRHDPAAKRRRVANHVSARETRALPGPGRPVTNARQHHAGPAQPSRVARPEAVLWQLISKPQRRQRLRESKRKPLASASPERRGFLSLCLCASLWFACYFRLRRAGRSASPLGNAMRVRVRSPGWGRANPRQSPGPGPCVRHSLPPDRDRSCRPRNTFASGCAK